MSDTQAANQGSTAAPGQAASAPSGAPPASGPQGAQGDQQPGSAGAPAAPPQGDSGTPPAGTPPAGTPPAAAPPASPVPVSYELRLPEKTALDQADLDAVVTMAKKHGWTNDQAQAALTEAHEAQVAQVAAFRTELEADREIGGAQLEAVQVQANRVLDRFAPASHAHGARLREAINKSGYGNYTPLVWFLSQIGKAMGEDTFQGGQHQAGGGGAPRSLADRLFPPGEPKK